MKVPFSWLNDYVDIDITAQELAEKLFSCAQRACITCRGGTRKA